MEFELIMMKLYRNKETGKLMRLEAAHWDGNLENGKVHLVPDAPDWSGTLKEFYDKFEPV